MRIVYTNLTEDDAGLKRSVRQLTVDFAVGGRPRCADEAPRAALPEGPSCVPAQKQPAPALARPAAEGIAALRALFIRKFVDAQGPGCPEPVTLSITV